MGRSFERLKRNVERFEYRMQRDRLRQMRCENLRHFRTRVRRANDGKVLGVFKGIADSMDWSVRWTRILGVIGLMFLASMFGVEGVKASLLAWGFFYMLLAMLMGPARADADYHPAATVAGSAPGVNWRAPERPAWKSSSSSTSSYSSSYRPPMDLASLDRQFESLNRRIRRMESVVTDPGYDWERRLGK